MSLSKGQWTQFEVKVMAGAELWLLVRHRGGTFKIPAYVEASELLNGVKAGWVDRPSGGTRMGGRVTISLEELLRLQNNQVRAPGRPGAASD